ncbi:hypothetical protein B0T16DRAFT_384263 [Cercophora newfieldiana]|uniref:Uncharacterized protein n=1 Tax=Cercophora newfieldiana TaxID=92897 RepID=A0AA40D021_9PEZI|nr:hypothetical protein B0T16DRAFT_384263 [Cercophora newfieldiana]
MQHTRAALQLGGLVTRGQREVHRETLRDQNLGNPKPHACPAELDAALGIRRPLQRTKPASPRPNRSSRWHQENQFENQQPNLPMPSEPEAIMQLEKHNPPHREQYVKPVR